MNSTALKIDKVLNALTVSIAFLLPLFFLPLTIEFFEFNKLALLTVYTVIIAVLWCVKLLVTGKVNVVKSPVNTPFLALTVVFLLATVFSLDTTSSLFGSYGRWFPSLFGLVTLVGFYFITAINSAKQNTAPNVLIALVAAGTVSSVAALLSYFGIYLSNATYMQNANFNLTGSVTTTAVLAGLAVILSLGFLLKTNLIPVKILLVQTCIVNFVVLALYNSLAAWVFVIISVVLLLLAAGVEKLKQNTVYFSVTVAAIVTFVALLIAPQTAGFLQNKSFSNEVQLPYAVSWKVAASTVSDFPILGTGLGTFALNYTRYKPAVINTTDYWNVRFDKPHNEFFDLLGAVGIVGTLVAVYFGVIVTKYALKAIKKRNESTTNMLLGISILGMLTLMLFTYATVTTTFILVLLLALLSARIGEYAVLSLSSLSSMSIINDLGNEKALKKEILQYFIVIPVLAIAVIWGQFLYKTYAAEHYAFRSLVAELNNDWLSVYANQQRAFEVLGNTGQRAEYHNTYARTNLVLAELFSAEKELTDEQKQEYVQELVSQAIRSVRLSTEVINPLLAASWETRAGVYNALRSVAEDADQWAATSYEKAIQLDPTNPRLRLEMGGLFFSGGDYLTAANLFRQATNLKLDYANAHYNLAQALIKLENYALALSELEITARLVQQNAEDYDKVMKEIEELKQMAELTGTKPTVQELEGDNNATPTVQEALTPPGTPAQPIDNVNQVMLDNSEQTETDTEPDNE